MLKGTLQIFGLLPSSQSILHASRRFCHNDAQELHPQAHVTGALVH